ncbi:MAG: methylated-DNA--[protein]-cysteine S-methyltransferase [Vampirovibrionales bacterium]|nr:methylated-DNA--[protein]-cysteine S-methyltransferase [Vampirovibrionales bacterium]
MTETALVFSPFGYLQLVYSPTHLLQAVFCPEPPTALKAHPINAPSPGGIPAQFLRWLQEPLNAPVPPYRLVGTPFQEDVWRTAMQIPYGQTQTYGALAKRLGRPTASRAVGQALGRNTLALIVPCHRVIQQSGQLGGFAWGLPLKQRLLHAEQAASLRAKLQPA